jgi:predicted transcriptional regulator
MATPKEYTLSGHLEKKILKALTIQNHTTRELAGLLDANYYTIRKILQGLEDTGVLKIMGFRGNARVYALAKPGDVVARESIPSTRDQRGNKLKLSALLTQVGMENTMLGGKAATALPRTMARLFMAALRYDSTNGEYAVIPDLEAINLEMTTNLGQLKFLVKLYETILASDAFWDTDRLRNIPHDVDFDEDQVIKAYQHYYPNN